MKRTFVKAVQVIEQWYQRLIRHGAKGHVRSFVSLFLVGVGLSVAIASCSASNATLAPKPDAKLKLVSFSVTQAPYEQIIPQFVAKWKKEHNQNVTFEQSFGPSGAQARAVIDGSQEADLVHLSLALDVNKIQQADLIQPNWEKEAPKSSIVTRSAIAIVTRPDNPKGIKTWADLTKDGLNIITPNPKTSGVGVWNFLGLWGQVTQNGGDEAQALDFITKVYKNAPILPASSRDASDLFFKQGKGDVLINYENEVMLAEQNGQKLPYVIPDVNISIDNPVAIVDKNVDKHNTREIAKAFVEFLYTSEAQREFAKVGYRPVHPFVVEEVTSKYPEVQTLFTSQDLGGWEDVQKKFFSEGALFDKVQIASKA
ncbi:MAG TPA: sulfate ABC transporter substrate-binding protein [Cyanobacteria bacterium UBA8543]|nr:sulfate ABC transporter substrate-binding protein [Cyanobacteria bacterium UBA8543]